MMFFDREMFFDRVSVVDAKNAFEQWRLDSKKRGDFYGCNFFAMAEFFNIGPGFKFIKTFEGFLLLAEALNIRSFFFTDNQLQQKRAFQAMLENANPIYLNSAVPRLPHR